VGYCCISYDHCLLLYNSISFLFAFVRFRLDACFVHVSPHTVPFYVYVCAVCILRVFCCSSCCRFVCVCSRLRFGSVVTFSVRSFSLRCRVHCAFAFQFARFGCLQRLFFDLLRCNLGRVAVLDTLMHTRLLRLPLRLRCRVTLVAFAVLVCLFSALPFTVADVARLRLPFGCLLVSLR